MDSLKKLYDSLVGEKHEVSESIREALEERIQSPFYGYFAIAWVLVNWDYIYTALFVDGQFIFNKTGLLKNEYLLQEILPEHLTVWMYWFNFFIYPLFLPFIAVWIMPYVIRFFDTKHLRNKIAMEEIRLSETAVEVRAEAKLIAAETELLEAETVQAKATAEAIETSPELVWRKEFDLFKKHPLYFKFQQVIDSIYKYNGSVRLRTYNGSRTNFDLDQDMLVYADVNELITTKDDGKIQLTKKGRAFVKYYT